MNVLVTGGAGFVGRRLVPRLRAAGHRVHVIDVLAYGQWPPACDGFVRMDLTDPEVARAIADIDPEVVIHLAANAHVGSCEADRRSAYRQNVTATANLVRSLRSSALVVASSAAVYAPGEDVHRETDSPAPASVYGWTKELCEMRARLYHERTRAPVWVLRLANVYGPGDMLDRVVPEIVRQVIAGQTEVRLRDPDARRDFIYLDDVVSLLERAVAGCVGWRVVNVGSGSTLSIREVVGHVSAAAGRRLRIVSGAAAGSGGISAPVRMDVTRMRSMFPDLPATPFGAGMERMLREAFHEAALAAMVS